jgi:cob(I)alamin adenosyltransferase
VPRNDNYLFNFNMKIYTKTGDLGTTSLLSGNRVSKANLRVDAYGAVDELNSHIGLLEAHVKTEHYQLASIQHILFNIGSLLAADSQEWESQLPQIEESDITIIEELIDKYTNELPVLRAFILPGGSIEAAQAHICRTVCRRAERVIVHLAQNEEINSNIIKYLNRLSDYLFVIARHVLHSKNIPEVLWKSK